MNPEQQNQQNPQNQPQVFQQGGAPTQPQTMPAVPPALSQNSQQKSKKKLFIVIGAAVSVLVLLLIVVLVFSSSNPEKGVKEVEQTPTSNGPVPATAISTEQLNNSISQDLSGVDDETTFPVDQLSDDALGL